MSFFSNPFASRRQKREEQFLREREELSDYFQAAVPLAMLVQEHYEKWREAISEPIQDGQRAANISATFWWQMAERLRRFEEIVPPKPAERYHKLFGQALVSASEGADTAKNGFRFSKFYVISQSMGYLDQYVELMAEAEQELRRLVEKYHLIEDAEGAESPAASAETQGEGESTTGESKATGHSTQQPAEERPTAEPPSQE
ncbi:MAG TPA: hypothetical protein VHS28_00825 [Chloroflexota bacterium]|nr:hypothetical protein [Chloroflexota bacterium]